MKIKVRTPDDKSNDFWSEYRKSK